MKNVLGHASAKPPRFAYPIVYWAALAFIVGVPNFVHFDQTGRTSNQLNLTSICNILLSLVVGYVLVLTRILEKQARPIRKIKIYQVAWYLLLGIFLWMSLFHPDSRLTAPKPTDVLLPLFFLGQWSLAFVLFSFIFTRAPADSGLEMLVRLVGRASWIWIALVWTILPIMRDQVYGAAADATVTVRQLGGQLIHPGKLSYLSSTAFFYALFFFKPGFRKWVACTLALVTLALTHARTGQLGFVVVLLIYGLFYTKKPAVRWATASIVAFSTLIAVLFGPFILKYVARGQSLQSLSTLDDRTRVWQASFEAIKLHPLFGYGYGVGARNALRDNWKYVHWIPPHAHNEFIETALAGGIFALVLVLFIWLATLFRLLKSSKKGPLQLFLLLSFLQLWVTALSGPLLSFEFQVLGAVFMICCIAGLAGDSSVISATMHFRVLKSGASNLGSGQMATDRTI